MRELTSPAETQARVVVCIAGMHRSGTSMIARLLNLAGVYLGDEKDLIPAAEDNPEGFWEHVRFQAINEEILSAFGGSWDLPPRMEPGWEMDPRLLFIRSRAIALIREFSGHRIWGWKDPRTSLTLPFWQSLIPDLKVVICLRSPYDVFRSLERRGYASSAFAYDLWLEYSRRLMAAASRSDPVVTHFDAYFPEPRAELRRLTDALGLSVTDETIEVACKTASVRLRHSHSTVSDLLATNASSELIRLYGELSRLAGPAGDLIGSTDECPAMEGAGAEEGKDPGGFEALASALKVELQLKNVEIHKKDEALRQNMAETRELLEQLAGARSQLQALLESRGWRILGILRKVRVFLVPVNSRRERMLKAAFRWIAKLRAALARRPAASSAGENHGIEVQKTSEPSAAAYRDMIANAGSREGSEYVQLAGEEFSSQEAPLKLIAFYLPQYHPIPENDEWWGRGFTEWSNVTKAVPQFVGHYQPRLPGELGFYDLRVPEVQARQIELARKYGIHGFAFHYYWFNGKRLLERPLDMFLQSSNDFPFCLCWANENWTRRWDGQESQVLITQQHSAESDLLFIHDIIPILQDPRYIRIHGRPLLIVYRPDILPDVTETVARWRKYCRDHQMPEPYLVAAQTFGFTDPRQVGFDAAVEFPPHNELLTDIRDRLQISNPWYQGNVVDYREIVQKSASRAAREYKLFKTVFPAWDNEARKPGRGYTFAFSTPGHYKDWLLKAGRVTLKEADPESRLLFINAWNEWGEGAYLEPDRRYGYAYLQATADALRELSGRPAASSAPAQFEKLDPRLLNPVIIFQPGKVGSMSVQASLQNKYQQLGLSTPIHHAHILENIDQRIEYISRVRVDPANTIKKLLESKELRSQIDSDPEAQWNVISLVRDPVGQKISALFQLIDEYLPDWENTLARGKLNLQDMQKMLLEKEEFEIGRLDGWFDSQIKAIWGIDIYALPFDKEKGYQIYRQNPRVNLMIIRLEDLNRVAREAFREFLGLEGFSIASTNVGEEKPYQKLYRDFKKLPVPVQYLEEAYRARYARHFYTDQETENFRERWLHPERAKEAA